MIGLTDEEIHKYCKVSDVQISDQVAGTYDAKWKYWNIDGLLKAQLKKVVEWLELNSEEGPTYSILESPDKDGKEIKIQEAPHRIILGDKWQALLEEIK